MREASQHTNSVHCLLREENTGYAELEYNAMVTVEGREEARKKSEAIVEAAPEGDSQASAGDDGRTTNAEEETMRTDE